MKVFITEKLVFFFFLYKKFLKIFYKPIPLKIFYKPIPLKYPLTFSKNKK